MLQQKSQVIQDSEGAVSLTWVTPGVLYARFEKALSAGVGKAMALALHAHAASVSSLEFYADASSLTQYDLTARSAFVRAVLSNRPKFSSIVILTWAGGISPAARSMLEIIGQPSEMLTEAAEFDLRLLRITPHAPQIISSLKALAREERRLAALRQP